MLSRFCFTHVMLKSTMVRSELIFESRYLLYNFTLCLGCRGSLSISMSISRHFLTRVLLCSSSSIWKLKCLPRYVNCSLILTGGMTELLVCNFGMNCTADVPFFVFQTSYTCQCVLSYPPMIPIWWMHSVVFDSRIADLWLLQHHQRIGTNAVGTSVGFLGFYWHYESIENHVEK